MALRPDHTLPQAGESAPTGLIVLLGEVPGAPWRYWRVEDGALDSGRSFAPGHDRPWNEDEAMRALVLVPAALAPVRDHPRGEMTMAQALATARLDPPGLRAPLEQSHVAVAATADGERVLSAAVAKAEMDVWLAELAANGIDARALLPAALVLPRPDPGHVATGELAGQMLARTPDMAFAGEADLVDALVGDAVRSAVDGDSVAQSLLAQFAAPELDLRQGPYALARVSYFRLTDWTQLVRMAAVLALLIFGVFLVETIRLNIDASAREESALTAAREQFPGVGDLASAESQIRTELVRRGAGGADFADAAPAVFAAMQPVPSIRLRNLSWRGDGTLAIRAAAPSSEALNQMLIALQRDGWQVTVPPELAPDATGASVADITVRAP